MSYENNNFKPIIRKTFFLYTPPLRGPVVRTNRARVFTVGMGRGVMRVEYAKRTVDCCLRIETNEIVNIYLPLCRPSDRTVVQFTFVLSCNR